MQVRYIRKLMTSHMILEQGERLSTWEERMIAHTSLEHMLFAECIAEMEEIACGMTLQVSSLLMSC